MIIVLQKTLDEIAGNNHRSGSQKDNAIEAPGIGQQMNKLDGMMKMFDSVSNNGMVKHLSFLYKIWIFAWELIQDI